MGRRLRFSSKLAASFISLVMIMNSIGITVLAEDNMNVVRTGDKDGEYADHVHITAAIGPDIDPDFSTMKFRENLEFNRQDDLLTPNNRIYIKVELDDGYHLIQTPKDRPGEYFVGIRYYAFNTGSCLLMDNDDIVADGIYKLAGQPESDCDVRFELSISADEFGVSITESDTGRYKFSDFKKNDEAFDISTGTAHAMDDVISFNLTAPEGCSINSVTVTRTDNQQVVPVTRVDDRLSFTMPASNVSIEVDSSTNIYYSDSPFTDPTAKTYVEPDHYSILSSGNWYVPNDEFDVINKDVTISSPLHIMADANIILCDGATLTAENGIYIHDGATLTIYGQENHAGTLIVHPCDNPDLLAPFIDDASLRETYYRNALTGPGSYRVMGGKVVLSNDGNGSSAINENTKFAGIGTGFCMDCSGTLINLGHQLHGSTFDYFNENKIMELIKQNDTGNVVFDTCSHPVSASTLYLAASSNTDPHTHTIDICTYCLGGSGVAQQHTFSEDGTCLCQRGIQAYHIICDDQNVSYGTSFENGDPTEWFLNGDVAIVRINSPEGHIYTATFANVGNIGPEVTGNGSEADPYKVRFGNYNVRMTVTDHEAYRINVTDPDHGSLRVKNFYGVFVNDEVDRIAAPGTTVSLDPVSQDGYTLRNIVVTCADGDIHVTMNPSSGYYEFVMPEQEVTVTPTFEKGFDSYQIIIPEFDHGTVVADVESAADGSTVNLYVSVDEGYHLESLGYGKGGVNILDFDIVDGKVLYSLVMPASDITVSAVFAPDSFSVTYPIDSHYTLSMLPASIPAGQDVSIEIYKEDDHTVITGVRYQYTKGGTTHTENAVLTEGSLGNTAFEFTMPAANITLIIDYAFDIICSHPNLVRISSAGHEVSYARKGDVINLSAVQSDMRLESATVTDEYGTAIALDGLSFVMPDGYVNVSVIQSDFDELMNFTVLPPEHGTLTAMDADGNEISAAGVLDRVYIELTLDPGYKLVGDIQDHLVLETYNSSTEQRDFYRESKYKAYTTLQQIFSEGRFKLDEGCIVPDTYNVIASGEEYFTLDHADGIYQVGETVTVDLHPHDGAIATGLNIRRNGGDYDPVPYTMNEDYTQATFTMPGYDVLMFAENTRIFYYDPFTESVKTQDNVGYFYIEETGEITLDKAWYSTRSSAPESGNAVIRIAAGKDVNLILRDGCTLGVGSVILEEGATFTIWAQSAENSGKLICDASSDSLPGIGAPLGVTSANIVINGGNIKATGGSNAAGIGTVGEKGTDQPDVLIMINAGIVDASGGVNAAGIGGGLTYSCGSVKINGGRVTARGGANAAGIGGGKNSSSGSILITGGSITAIGGMSGAGIGSGIAARKTVSEDSIRITGGEIYATGGFGGAGIGSGEKSWATSVMDIEISGGEIDAIGSNFNDDESTGSGSGVGSGANCMGTLNITVTGGVLHAIAGTSEDPDDVTERATAIGLGESSGNKLTYVLGDEMKVICHTAGSIDTMVVDRSGDEIVDNRIIIRETATDLEVMPCEHSDIEYDVHGGDNDHHTEVCPNCLRAGDLFDHEFVDGACICGAYQITFDGNGGTGEMDALTIEPQTVGEAETIPFPVCEFGGVMEFAGWKINGEGELITEGDIFVTVPVTLVAQWMSNTVSVADPDVTGKLITINKISGDTYLESFPVNSEVELLVVPADGYRLSPVAYYECNGTRAMMNYAGDGKYTFVMPGGGDVKLEFVVAKTTDIVLTAQGSGVITSGDGVTDSMTYEGAEVSIGFSYLNDNTRLLSIRVMCGSEELEIRGLDESYPYMPDEIRFTVPDAVEGELDTVTVSAEFAPGYKVNYPTQTSGTVGGAEDRFSGGADHLIPAGETVEFSAIPADGNVTMSVSVLSASGTSYVIPFKVMGNNRYSFVMPEFDVSVGASFRTLRSISYDPNGGSGIMTSTTVQPGTKFRLPECKFDAPAGTDFIGWKIADREALYSAGDEVIIPENGPTEYVITACWETTWSAVKRDLEAGRSIVLMSDIQGLIGESDVEGYDLGDLYVPKGTTSTIDLNGHTISRTGPYRGASNVIYSAFIVEGDLTVTDSSEAQTGKITDSDYGVKITGAGNAPRFCLFGGSITGVRFDGVMLNSTGGTFVLSDGASIDHNNRGVQVIAGDFIMTGGNISDNYCDTDGTDGTIRCGAGVLVNGSSRAIFDMRGGTITRNTVYGTGTDTLYGGGVYVQTPGKFKLRGSSEIYGNKVIRDTAESLSDVALYGDEMPVIEITGALENDNPIGIMCLASSYNEKTAVFTSSYDQNGDETNFKSDVEGYAVGINGDGEAMFGPKVTMSFEQNGGCSGEQETEYSVAGCRYILPECTFVAPEGEYLFIGWTDKNDNGTDPHIYQAGDIIENVSRDMTFLPFYKEVPDQCAIIHSSTASFDDRIKMNFYVEIPEELAEGATAVLSLAGDDQISVNVSDCYTGSDSIYRFSKDLLPRQLEDDVTLKLFNEDGSLMTIMNAEKTNDYTYTGVSLSLLTYCDSFIGTDDKMADLAQAVKDYGYAAKQRFVGNGVYPISAEVGLVGIDDLADYVPTASGKLPDGLTIESQTALFQSDNSYRIYLKFTDKDPSAFTFKLDGKDTELQQRGERYYLTFTGVDSTKIQETHTFTFSDGASTYTLNVSTLSYVHACLKYSDNLQMIELAKALYLYNKAALEYFG